VSRFISRELLPAAMQEVSPMLQLMVLQVLPPVLRWALVLPERRRRLAAVRSG
jgi:hypothetical protein